MQELQIFNNQEFGTIRATEINGNPYFVGKDIAEALGYTNPQKAIRDHVDQEDKTLNESFTVNGTMAVLISESGVYSLVFGSQLPKAKEFKHWVTSEVLPTIRKHGAYMTPETLEKALLNPDGMIKVLQALKEEQNKNKTLVKENSALTVQNETYRPKAEYFDQLVDRKLLTNFTDTAKELGVQRKKFLDFLFAHKYIYRNKHGVIKPYAQYADTDAGEGLFHIKECMNEKTDWNGIQTLVTVKGKETFRLLMTESES